VGDVVTFPPLTGGESGSPMAPRSLNGVGLDRLSLSFPLRRTPAPSLFAEASYSYETGRQRMTAPLGDEQGRMVHVSVATVDGKPWARLDANPARFRDPKGCSLLPLVETPLAVEAMLAVAEESGLVERDCDVEDVRVTRVDVARDYSGVLSPGVFVHGLRNVKRPYAKRVGVWSSAQQGNAQTLHVGSGAGMVRLYDQNEAYAEKGAERGSMRFEVEARKGWLREKFGVTSVMDLTTAALEALLMDRWEWSKMGHEVAGTVTAAQALASRVGRGDMTWQQARSYLGALQLESAGVGHGLSARQAKRFRSVMRELGIAAVVAADEVPVVDYAARLDFALGTEVAA
jgi:hypothetical protein